jgi:hypothetical protein
MLPILALCAASAAAQEALVGRWSSTRSAFAPAAAPAAAPLPRAAAAARAAVSGGGWPTEHQNTANSGATQFLGPISSGGQCVVPFFGLDGNTPLRFYSTGVTAATEGANAHFFGGSDNALRVVVKNATVVVPGTTVSTALTVSTCPLAPLRSGGGGAPAAEAFGLVASGTTWTALDMATDRLAIASADGTVYALNWQACLANASVCNTTSSIVSPNSLGGQARAGAGAGAGSSCVAWTFSSPADNTTGFPFLSPTRYYYAANISTDIVLATDTAKGGLNTGATTYALQGETGALLWSHRHIVGSTWYGSFGAVPAFDAVDNILFLAYGPGLVALDGSTGTLLGSWAGAGESIAASPTLIVPDNGGALWSVFLHTSLGALWKLKISQNFRSGAVAFTPLWRCDYALSTYWSTGKGSCTSFSAEEEEGGQAAAAPAAALAAALAAAAQEVVAVPMAPSARGAAPGAPASAAAAAARTYQAARGDFAVEGGFPQLTSPAQRQALWASIRARYAAAFPAGPASPLLPHHVRGLPPGVDTRALEASLMLSALPPAHAAAVRRGEDWAHHPDPAVAAYALTTGSSSAAAAAAAAELGAGVDYTSTFPYATPTLVSQGGQVALAQYVALGDSPTGLFVVGSLTGAVAWAYANTTLAGVFGTKLQVNFGRSRASPTVDGSGNLFGAWLPCC